jgi:hypothetical protein
MTATTAEKTTAHPNMEHAAAPASANAVNRALQQFMQSPSISNKVAAMVALQAYFEEVESRHAC